MSVTAHLQRILVAEVEANRRAIESIRSALKQPAKLASEWAHGKPPAARAAEVMGHINSARYEWLVRLEVLQKRPFVMWPTCGIDEVERECVMLDGAWQRVLEAMDDAKLAMSVRYHSNEGMPWVSTVEEIVTHVLNHSTYHRGQISMLVQAAGGERATTDFIGITRRSGMAGGSDGPGGPVETGNSGAGAIGGWPGFDAAGPGKSVTA